MERLNSIPDLGKLRESVVERQKLLKKWIRVCSGTACHSQESQKLVQALRDRLEEKAPGPHYTVKATGCNGFCAQGPIVVVEPENIFYAKVCPDRASEIVDTTVLGEGVIEDLLYVNPETGDKIVPRA